MRKSKKADFDYESKPFGLVIPSLAPWYFQALKLKYCLDILKETKGKVLEVGCGGGGMAKAIKLQRPDLQVFGCDISKRSLKMAKKDAKEVNFVYGDVYRLPFANKYFDILVSFDVLEHFKKPQKALKEINRVLKKRGVLHSVIPFEGDKLTLHGLLRLFGWKVKEKFCGHLQMYRFGEPEKLMEKAGFKVLGGPYSGHLFYQLADVLYFSFLFLLGKNADYQVEGYLEHGQPGIKRSLIKLLKNLVATLSFLESKVFFWFPGGFRHITAVKK